jgi:hypothetical protein
MKCVCRALISERSLALHAAVLACNVDKSFQRQQQQRHTLAPRHRGSKNTRRSRREMSLQKSITSTHTRRERKEKESHPKVISCWERNFKHCALSFSPLISSLVTQTPHFLMLMVHHHRDGGGMRCYAGCVLKSLFLLFGGGGRTRRPHKFVTLSLAHPSHEITCVYQCALRTHVKNEY